MQKLFDDVLIFCPEFKTGGPEALHQLAYRINSLGGSAQMVYYAPFSRIEIEPGVLRCHAGDSPMPAHFAQYRPRVLSEARMTPGTMVVFPEPLCAMASVAEVHYQRAVWWLSLDNAMPQNPALADPEYRQRFFGDPNLVHFYQCDYVRAYLEANKAARYHPLSDYTDPQFIHQSRIASLNPPIAARENRICYFPNKGAELAARFIAGQAELRQPVSFVPIREMTKPQVRDTLFGARLYVDFGGHPGKDRVPREAAVAGAIVLLHAAGAANHFQDHPLPAEYRFTEADIDSGRLHHVVDAILQDPDWHWARQRFYREAIPLERERFDLEVRGSFFAGG